jgi:hypothetical protein
MSEMAATDEDGDLSRLLDQVNAASLALQRSNEGVPDEVLVLADSLGSALPAGSAYVLEADPDQVARFFQAAYGAEKALRRPLPSARRRDLRLPLQQMRSALVEIIEDRPVAPGLRAVAVLRNLMGMVNLAPADLAVVLDVSTRELQRWLAPDARGPSGDDESRVRVVAQLVNQLRHSFTGTAVMKWFERPHPVLGVAPIRWLDDPLRYPELLAEARRSRFAPAGGRPSWRQSLHPPVG